MLGCSWRIGDFADGTRMLWTVRRAGNAETRAECGGWMTAINRSGLRRLGIADDGLADRTLRPRDCVPTFSPQCGSKFQPYPRVARGVGLALGALLGLGAGRPSGFFP